MDFVRHETLLDRPLKDGGTRRAVLELSASRGSQAAIGALIAPEYPESMGYLLSWAGELVGRSGVSELGVAPLSWATLDAWATRTQREPTPDECSALMQLDAVMIHPEPRAETPENTPAPAVVSAWPSKKKEG